MSRPAALELCALTKRYDAGLLALDRFDLELPDGSFFGLLGPNGACNLIRTTDGEVRIFGEPHHTPAARRMVGLAEQDVNLDRFLDVEETLLYRGGYYGMDRAGARGRAAEMMDVFDLRGKAKVRAPHREHDDPPHDALPRGGRGAVRGDRDHHLNPIFYLLNAVRYGFLGTADVKVGLSLAVCGALAAAVVAWSSWLFRTGRKLKP